MVVVDPAFQSAGKSVGLQIWRIKDFKVYPLESTQFGTFYGGDSYIVLSTYGVDARNLQYNVHMWKGEESTTDEKGTAAMKMVELDDSLGGLPVQYNETQNHESAQFLGLFKKGIKYMKEGHESGFKHFTKKDPEPRLFHVKGKRIVRVQQVDLTLESLNTSDAFILDVGHKLYVWMPPQCNRFERIKGVEQARSIRDQERSGRAELEILDSDWDTNQDFWKHFKGGPGSINSTQAKSDEDFMTSVKNKAILFKVSDASGKLNITKVGSGTPDYSMLDSKDAFILDTGNTGVFVWIGKKCTMNERRNAMNWATQYLREHGRPKWVQTVRVLEGAEPAIFHQWFSKGGQVSPGGNSAPSGKKPDLQPDDVMIMDTGAVVFVWIGQGANDAERAAGIPVAKKYLELSPIHRESNQIEVTDQGKEGELFKKQFQKWNPNFWKEHPKANIDDVFKSIHL